MQSREMIFKCCVVYHDIFGERLSSDIASAAQVKYKTSDSPKAEINL